MNLIRSILVTTTLACLVGMTASCKVQTNASQGGPYVPYVTDQTIINDLKVLNDGAGITWQLEPGHYRLEMTANNDGAAAEWIRGSCPKTTQMKQLSMECVMPSTGQLIITNPTTLGLGKQVSVTVRVTKLSH